MHRSPELLALLVRANAVPSDSEQTPNTDARQPIEVWRASPAGQRAEGDLAAAMKLSGTARRAALAQFLSAFAADLAGLTAALLNHARTNPAWQPPLNDFIALGQHGLHLIEKPEFRLSVLAVDAMPETPSPPVVRFGAGAVLFCVASPKAELSFHQWQRTGDHCIALPRAAITLGDVLHADLSERSLSVAHCSTPAALLRLQIHNTHAGERHFCEKTGQELQQVLGSDAFRRHLALAALSALGKTDHARDTLAAARDCRDDALAWHYMRQALALDGAAAAALLNRWAEGERPALTPLAQQTLAVLHAHYPELAAA